MCRQFFCVFAVGNEYVAACDNALLNLGVGECSARLRELFNYSFVAVKEYLCTVRKRNLALSVAESSCVHIVLNGFCRNNNISD